ncbi:MAG: undecaprenyldiphospho-muramoylpentapeptide beta-N-acetylglucosaminyltransferase [Coriobacteriia bacterium]|nr:undecaprenyldiphospho-muramoylpentapeptide beta-N-acetylglucosaminyltransferase [Coriobacteriia bacterium]MCL2750584.1 undecaprenyldiphospho-muramoylpentapeptide beta-N-acetylglucosaminyltransferase [Coriobacteriia bacterium]
MSPGKLVITSGGTAGHINPALAVAAELEQLGEEVIFVGSTGGMEERLARQAGLAYQSFDAKGFNRQRPWTLLTSSLILAQSTGKARRWLKEINAQAIAAFGGYVSVPVGRAAVREGIPLLIHEQNSHMGWSNRHLSSKAQVIALTYEAALEGLPAELGERVHVTGNPVRPEFSVLADVDKASALRSEFRRELGFGSNDLVLLIFGGSQGARHINQALVAQAAELMKRPGLSVLHLTGPKEYESVEAALAAALTPEVKERWQLLSYCDQMPAAFAAADLVLSRAGASSLAELAVAAKPAILIPFPYATADHQRKNAEYLVKAGAATMLLDSELESARFSETLFGLIDNSELRREMLKVAQTLSHADAAKQVAKLLLSIQVQ